MGAKLSRGTSANGVIAYQDDANLNQFHYFPARADLVLGDTLTTFEVDYWGINAKPYYIDFGNGNIESAVGGALSGTARIDITPFQRQSIVDAIRTTFKVQNPALLPMMLKNTTVTPVIASQATTRADVTFPKTVQLGSTFAYSVSARNSLFAEIAAGVNQSGTPRSDFSILVNGDAEFVGDPWTVKIEVDLSQVWSYVRTQIVVDVGWGWFSMDASYQSITESLLKQSFVKIDFVEGSLDNEKFGRQIFELGKTLYEAINKSVLGGEGLFRFEPNPNPQAANPGSGGGWPWSVSINASYSSQTFTQKITYKNTISYTGRVIVPMGTAMVLAVACGTGTSKYFNDFQNTSEPCLNQTKLDGLQARLNAEVEAKNKKALEYLKNLESGIWDGKKYQSMMDILKQITLTEGARAAKFPMSPRGHLTAWHEYTRDQLYARLAEKVQGALAKKNGKDKKGRNSKKP